MRDRQIVYGQKECGCRLLAGVTCVHDDFDGVVLTEQEMTDLRVSNIPLIKDPRSVFFTAMKEKMELRAREKGRTMTPWLDYAPRFLRSRLDEEYIEWKKSFARGYDAEADELLDIANFCMFRWIQLTEKN